MKKAIHIGIIILLLIGICLIEQLLAQNYLNEVKKKSENIKAVVSTTENVDIPELQNLTDDLISYWTAKENVLCTFVNHKDIEDIGAELTKMKSASRENDRVIFQESLNLISFYLMTYQHIVGINIQNIF